MTEESLDPEVLRLQSVLNDALIAGRDPNLPENCLPDEATSLAQFTKVAKLLEGGKGAKARPQDTEALDQLKEQLPSNPDDAVYWYLISKASFFHPDSMGDVKKYATLAQSKCEGWAALQFTR